MIGALRIDLKRKPYVGRGVEFRIEPGSENPHHLIWSPAQKNGFAQQLPVAAKTALPQPVADHGDMSATRPVFLRRERAPFENRRAEQMEVAGAYANGMDLLGG